MQRKREWGGGEEQGRRWMYKKPVLSPCAAPPRPPPRGWCDGVEMKEGLWRRSDPSLTPSKEEERDQSRGPWHSKRCQDTHTHSTFHIMHLTSFRSTFRRWLYSPFYFAWSTAFWNWPYGLSFFCIFSVLTAPVSSTCWWMATKAFLC